MYEIIFTNHIGNEFTLETELCRRDICLEVETFGTEMKANRQKAEGTKNQGRELLYRCHFW